MKNIIRDANLPWRQPVEKQVGLGWGGREKCWKEESWSWDLLLSQMEASLQNSSPVVQTYHVVKFKG